MTAHVDVAVIGGGIVGLAHAWRAAERGLRTVLFDRTAVAQGASVRNFGMVWPVGQPAGELYELALRSRDLWRQLGSQQVVSVAECGSIHLAHRPDELAVLEEFCASGSHQVRLLTPREVVERSPLANPDNLLGGMFSAEEVRVDPRTASSRITGWLAERRQVECRFNTPVTAVDDGKVRAADGRTWQAERVVVCSGSDLLTLYPEILQTSGLVLCKLQMLRTVAQPSVGYSTPHIASGLTLRHYTSFEECPSLSLVRERVAAETPELDQFGIHVMASVSPRGEVILGDSHEYGSDVTPFGKAEIDELILRELHKVIRLDDWSVQQRWHGVYAKHPERPVFETTADDGTCIFVGTGGAGMTLSFGLAERAWQRWMGESQ